MLTWPSPGPISVSMSAARAGPVISVAATSAVPFLSIAFIVVSPMW